MLHLTTTDISLELLLGPQLSAFIEAGYEVHGASAPGPFVDALEDRGVIFHALDHSTRSMSIRADVRAAHEAFSLFRDLSPDIVHTHNPKPGVYGRIAARLARVPVVVNTVHGLYAQPTDSFLRRVAVYSLERIAAIFSDAELVQNPEDVSTLRSLRVPRRKLTTLGNGVDLDRFKPGSSAERAAIRREFEIAAETVVVGAVGRLVEEKGYLELFESFRLVRDSLPDARLLVAGPHEPGKADALSEATIQQAEADGVIFLGHREDVHELYRAFDIYVLASHREGFPRSAMEAAATGLPLILTDIRGCRQVVDDGVTGRIVPVRDSEALGRAIAELCTAEDLRTQMGAAGLTKATREFDQQQVIDSTLATYQRLLASSPDSAPSQ